jgi:hypothetical protein
VIYKNLSPNPATVSSCRRRSWKKLTSANALDWAPYSLVARWPVIRPMPMRK